MINRIRGTFAYKYLAETIHKLLVKINPLIEINRNYRLRFHRKPNIENPTDLIEKIYWMQLNTDTSMWTKCADKYAMREYVKDCGYEEFLPKSYGHWKDAKEIDFSCLPNEFVLKSNNGCGTVMIVRDKSKLDEKKVRRKLNQWLKVPYGWAGAQLHYTRIVPCILAEELLHQDEERNSLSPGSLVDYKIWCINGEPESIWVAYNRHDVTHVNMALYDTAWHPLPQYLKSNDTDVYNANDIINKPICLEQMLEMAREISKPFLEVRVDFYIINDKPILGELTFTSGYGYFTDDYYQYLGDKLKIQKRQMGGAKYLYKRMLSVWHKYLYSRELGLYLKLKKTGIHIESRSLSDYKVWCFKGKPECVLVVHDRVQKENYTLDMYNTNWERIPNSLKINAHHSGDEDLIPRPDCLQEMLKIAADLSEPFPEVRVDFYVINNKPIVGELTFTSGYGNYTDDFYDYLGGKVVLPEIEK